MARVCGWLPCWRAQKFPVPAPPLAVFLPAVHADALLGSVQGARLDIDLARTLCDLRLQQRTIGQLLPEKFDSVIDRTLAAGRVAALREWLRQHDLDGFLVPRSDEHQGEYVAPCSERLKWLTGFTGSAGFCVVLPKIAGVFMPPCTTWTFFRPTGNSAMTALQSTSSGDGTATVTST